MAQGLSARETLDRLLSTDDEHEYRQVGLIDTQGTPAAFTGAECQEWAGALMGANYTVQGNLLVGAATVEAIARAFEDSKGELVDRLVVALAAGQRAGGDRRGQQAAAVLVVGKQGVYGPQDDRCVDLRVDDDPHPIERLKTLLNLHHLVFDPPLPDDWVKIEGEVGRQLQRILKDAGQYDGPITGDYDERTKLALHTLIERENLTGRFRADRGMIDRHIVPLLRKGPGIGAKQSG
jgi:uncharacterized Ntn-hydrolase superfamily protein